MNEATTDRAVRNAVEIAHVARATAIKDAWNWLRGRPSR